MSDEKMLSTIDVYRYLTSRDTDWKKRTNPVEGSNGSCVYTTESGEHCVAGQAMADLGVELPAIDSVQNCAAIFVYGGWGHADFVRQSMTDEAALMLGIAQYHADRGYPWGVAAKLAVMAYELSREGQSVLSRMMHASGAFRFASFEGERHGKGQAKVPLS